MDLDTLKIVYRNLAQMSEVCEMCAYCGAVGSEVEHVIPYSYLIGIVTRTRKRIKPKQGKRALIVKSCRECNRKAGAKVFENFWEKKQYIHDQVEKKYEKLLKSPEWTEEETREMDNNFQIMIYADKINKEIVRIRLENLLKPEIFGEPVEYI